MDNDLSQFGAFLAAARNKRGFSQWNVSMRSLYQVLDVSSAENGLQEPRVTVLMNLCLAYGMHPHDFFPALYRHVEGGPLEVPDVDPALPPLLYPLKRKPCLFGPLFKRARTSVPGMSQAVLAAEFQYDKRNFGRIENGSQEPGGLLTLRMVGFIGVDMAEFYDTLYKALRNDMETMPSV